MIYATTIEFRKNNSRTHFRDVLAEDYMSYTIQN